MATGRTVCLRHRKRQKGLWTMLLTGDVTNGGWQMSAPSQPPRLAILKRKRRRGALILRLMEALTLHAHPRVKQTIGTCPDHGPSSRSRRLHTARVAHQGGKPPVQVRALVRVCALRGRQAPGSSRQVRERLTHAQIHCVNEPKKPRFLLTLRIWKRHSLEEIR